MEIKSNVQAVVGRAMECGHNNNSCVKKNKEKKSRMIEKSNIVFFVIFCRIKTIFTNDFVKTLILLVFL
jgi:uncharacterized protein Veg